MKKILTLLISQSILLLYPLTTFAINSNLKNALGEGTTIESLVGRVIHAFLGLSGVIALAMFTWGGFLWLTSAGGGNVEKGKKTLIWASLGLVVIFTSYILVTAVVDALTTGDVISAPSTPTNPGNAPAPVVVPFK